jgi:hypothetical protein
VTQADVSRRELAAVAAALLLPIPLLVASGLRIPLPGAVERAVASLAPGGDHGGDGRAPAVRAAPAQPRPELATPRRVRPESATAAPASRSHGVSSTMVPPTVAPSAAATADQTETTTAPERDAPSLPVPHTDDHAAPGADTDADAPAPPAAAPAETGTVEPGPTVTVDVAGASVDITATGDGATVDTGGAGDVGPPVEVPIAPPTLPPLLP